MHFFAFLTDVADKSGSAAKEGGSPSKIHMKKYDRRIHRYSIHCKWVQFSIFTGDGCTFTITIMLKSFSTFLLVKLASCMTTFGHDCTSFTYLQFEYLLLAWTPRQSLMHIFF